MPFEKVETTVDFPSLENAILAYWKANGIFEKRRALNTGKPKWKFLDGPITANNPMGVHHAWGRTYKDVYNRYFAMSGHELRYQNGFDCQGLWVEVEVEKALELKSKRDIENLVSGDTFASIDKFVQECKDRVNKFARIQTNQSIRLGYWMDWDTTDADWAKTPDERKSYFTMSEENNYTIWSFLKKCHCKGLIHRGYDVMPWCGRCGVGISEQEMKEGYKSVEHRACFVKFPLKGRDKENLLVWTTTPWTLTSNVGAAINPELTYLKVKLKDEIYYVAKGAFKLNRMESSGSDEDGEKTTSKQRDWLDGVPHLVSIEQHFKVKAGKGESYEIAGEIKGEEMLGWEYIGPFDELPAQNSEYGFPEEVSRITKQSGKWPAKTGAQSHRVVSGGKDVTETEGTGIVHTAPGCGAIDYRWGQDNGLPPIAPIGDDGIFVEGFCTLTGKNAAESATADAVFELLKAKGILFTTERYVHRYPHCWRCKTELLYRLVDEWFINMGPKNTEEGFRGEIMKVVEQVEFLPESLNGKAREHDWLWNMGDWMISKKRYWGLALPIWVDEQDPTQFEVIGGYEELKSRAVEGWDEFSGHTPHRPWIDKVKIKNPKTGNVMSRISDVGNPWLDAGIVAFSTMKYNTDRAYWNEWYPADFITESFPGQFRNWFYALLAMSTMMSDGKPPFKTLFGFATVKDQIGREMHKSEGNSIEFIGAADNGYTIDFEVIAKANIDDVEKAEKVEKARLENIDKLLKFTMPAGEVAKVLKAVLTAKPEASSKGTDKKDGTEAAFYDTLNRVLKSAIRRELVEKERTEGGAKVKYHAIRAHYGAMSADVLRWVYCRHEPAANIRFGPLTADEVRSRVFIKLWNIYGMFCNYAIGDNFDPGAPQVPVAERQDIDRWLLANLNKLINTANDSYRKYNVMDFALAAENFIEADLSNWYVRRNKDRMHSKNTDLDAAGLKDKHAAYQTLYTTIKTLCQLMAPCIPFITEAMWKNLRLPTDPESVHLCDFPQADSTLLDKPLSEAMATVQRVISIGLSARQKAKLPVRQALATLVVQAKDEAVIHAVQRFPDLILDELNLKAVRIYNPATDPADYTAQPGWATASEGDTIVALDTTITEALKLEGLSRDAIRHIQNARKDAKLDLLDKIELHLATPSEDLAKAIAAHRAHIATSVQATAWSDTALAGDNVFTASPDVNKNPLTIQLRKV